MRQEDLTEFSIAKIEISTEIIPLENHRNLVLKHTIVLFLSHMHHPLQKLIKIELTVTIFVEKFKRVVKIKLRVSSQFNFNFLSLLLHENLILEKSCELFLDLTWMECLFL